LDYAAKFWDRPCDDGVFWLTDREVVVERKRKELKAPAKDGWEARFVPTPDGAEEAAFIRPNAAGQAIPPLPGRWEKLTIQGWAGLADCAHHLSRCLRAGGLADVSALAVRKLVAALQARPDTRTLAERVPTAAAQRVIDSGVFRPGDIIGYY